MDHTLQALQAYIEWPSSIFLSKGVLQAKASWHSSYSLPKRMPTEWKSSSISNNYEEAPLEVNRIIREIYWKSI